MERIRQLRQEKGLSQVKLAVMADMDPATLNRLEQGKGNPNLRTLERVAEALGVEVVDLLGKARPAPRSPQGRLFNNGNNGQEEEQRRTFIERVKEYIETRVAHYENRLAEAEREGGVLAGYEGARMLFDDALDEFIHLPDLINGELAERWMLDPEVPEGVKVDLGRSVGEVMKPLVEIVGRIGEREKDLAKTEAQRIEAEKRREQMLEHTRKISAA
jgi:transcriptional regulator with XRE-family HTH domain